MFTSIADAQIRLTQVDPANSLITIQNFGSSAVNIQQYRLCALFEYESLSGLNISVFSGGFNLSPGSSVVFQWAASSGFNATASDLGLYLPTGSYSDPAVMIDFMQYGASGQGRENVAQQAGLWEAGTFLTGTGPWSYSGDGTQNTIAYWLSSSVPGCTNNAACNYNPDATEEDNSCIFPGESCDDGNVETVNDALNPDCICVGEILGCTDVNACNFNPNAQLDNGICYFPGDICDDGDMNTINDTYSTDCICQGEVTAEIYGCMNMEACNYNAAATIDDGSCIIPGSSCDDGNDMTVFDMYTAECICVGQLLGCSVPDACNYSGATVDDGSCVFPGDMCDDGDSMTENDMYTADCACEGTPSMVFGCTLSIACNYNPEASTDDGSCLFPGDTCDDGDATTTDDVYNTLCECVGTPTSVDEALQVFHYFPNPASNFVRIESADGRMMESIELRDMQGRIVLNQRVSASATGLSLENLASGRYVVVVRTTDATYSLPLDILHP